MEARGLAGLLRQDGLLIIPSATFLAVWRDINMAHLVCPFSVPIVLALITSFLILTFPQG